MFLRLITYPVVRVVLFRDERRTMLFRVCNLLIYLVSSVIVRSLWPYSLINLCLIREAFYHSFSIYLNFSIFLQIVPWSEGYLPIHTTITNFTWITLYLFRCVMHRRVIIVKWNYWYNTITISETTCVVMINTTFFC